MKMKKTTKTVKTVGDVVVIPRGYDRPVFQGDMMLFRVQALPGDAKQLEHHIVAHSETGHHHVAEKAAVFSTGDAMTLFLRAIGKEPVDIVHQRPHDTHKTIRLPAGEVWGVRRQREHSPEGWRVVMD